MDRAEKTRAEFFSTKISAIVLAVHKTFWTIKRRFHLCLALFGQMNDSPSRFSARRDCEFRLHVTNPCRLRGGRGNPHDLAGPRRQRPSEHRHRRFLIRFQPPEHRDLWPFRRCARPSAGWRHGFRDWFNHQGFHGIAAGRDGDARRSCDGRSRRKISSRQR